MIHEDGTMDVMVDGRVVRRRYSVDITAGFGQQYEPDTYDGEMVMWTVSSDVPTDVPTIIRTQQASGPDYSCACCGPSLRDLLYGDRHE